MEVDDAASSRSSSLSSPRSPQAPFDDVIRVHHPQLPDVRAGGVAASPQSSADVAHVTTSKQNAKNTAAHDTPKIKRPRKKKDPDADAKNKADDKPKEKKPRKPRTVNPNGTKPGPAKKQKVAEVQNDAQPRQLTIGEMTGQFQTPIPPPPPPPPQMQRTPSVSVAREPTLAAPSVPASRPASSGQRYDPIRAMTIQSHPAPAPAPAPTPSLQVSPRIHRASASPAIASLIDPPAPTPAATLSTPSQTPRMQTVQPTSTPTPPQPVVTRPTENFQQPMPTQSPQPSIPNLGTAQLDGAMDVITLCDREPFESPKVKPQEDKIVPIARPASSAPPTKSSRPTPPASKPLGSGLLSSSDLFGGPRNPDGDSERRGVDINIQITLDPSGGNTVNIAHEILKKYGRDAINPRAAAHRERLLQVQAAANRLEMGSADDMSVDLSEMENDSNTEMGGMDDEKSGSAENASGEKPRQRKRRKQEDYDKEDDFIDDTELVWQEQAAVAKDGFFVYSGPLVPEGEKAQIERSVIP